MSVTNKTGRRYSMYRINRVVREMAVVTGHFKACLEGPRRSTECVSLLLQPQPAVCSQSFGYSHQSVVGGYLKYKSYLQLQLPPQALQTMIQVWIFLNKTNFNIHTLLNFKSPVFLYQFQMLHKIFTIMLCIKKKRVHHMDISTQKLTNFVQITRQPTCKPQLQISQRTTP